MEFCGQSWNFVINHGILPPPPPTHTHLNITRFVCFFADIYDLAISYQFSISKIFCKMLWMQDLSRCKREVDGKSRNGHGEVRTWGERLQSMWGPCDIDIGRAGLPFFVCADVFNSMWQWHKGLVINYGEGGLQNGKIGVRNFWRPPPPPPRQRKTFQPPLPLFLKEWKLFADPPSIWLKLQATT